MPGNDLVSRRGTERAEELPAELNDLTGKIIGAAMTVHRELGLGLLESVYQQCLVVELEALGLKVEVEVAVPVIYRGRKITDDGFRIDILINDTVVVELKSVQSLEPVHAKQVLTYLRLAQKPVGLLINFNDALLKDGITRLLNPRRLSAPSAPLREATPS